MPPCQRLLLLYNGVSGWQVFDVSPSTTVSTLLGDVKMRLGISGANSFALYQVLPEDPSPPSTRHDRSHPYLPV